MVAAALLAALLATAAYASHGDPGEPTPIDDPGQTTAGDDPDASPGLDTDATPVAKRTALWEQVAGAQFGSPQAPKDSLTPYDLDFFSVSFYDQQTGFAVGAQCKRGQPDKQVTGNGTASCERVPVIYRYTAPKGQPAKWEEVYRAKEKGYVGALAWLSPERALAVGGSGAHPRRELERAPGESDADYAARDLAGEEPNAAGRARAWLYEDGRWRELRNLPDGSEGDELPDALRGLSALAASPRKSDCGADTQTECAFAGAYRQLWRFRDGRFDQGYSDQSPETEVENAAAFRFRVRELRFVEGATAPAVARVVAVTSGCCAQLPGDDVPLVLFNDGKWHVRPQAGPRITNPDSYYSMLLRRSGDGVTISALVTPGGPRRPAEPASRLTPPGSLPYPGCEDEACVAGAAMRSSVRLLSAGGDLVSACRESGGGYDTSFSPASCALGGPDGVPDWAVGVLGSSGQGVAYTTATALNRMRGPLPSPANWPGGLGVFHDTLGIPDSCTGSEDAIPLTSGDQVKQVPGGQGNSLTSAGFYHSYDTELCTPQAYRKLAQSRGLFKLPSYALNSLQLVGGTARGWAVGDHGALMRIGGGPAVGAAAGDAAASLLSRHEPAALSDTSPYEAFRPTVTRAPGLVPPLSARPPEQLPGGPRFVPGGSPDTVLGTRQDEEVNSIVMSRDGREGWALGPGDNRGGAFVTHPAMTLHHYDGSTWSRCGPDDPACAGLPRGYLLRAAARVPYENDPKHPELADKFEVVAVGDGGLVLRYSNGSWKRDQSTMSALGEASFGDLNQLVDVAYTAPDDGWMVGGNTFRSSKHASIYHFDDKGWTGCGYKYVCADLNDRLVSVADSSYIADKSLRLTTAGPRIYLFGTRNVAGSVSSSVPPDLYPLILYRDRRFPCNQAGDPGCWRGTADGSDGGFDPGCASKNAANKCDSKQEDHGRVFSVAVAERADGFEGWAVGQFGGTDSDAKAVLLRLEGGRWSRWSRDDASADYPLRPDPQQQLTLPGAGGERSAFLGWSPALAFNERRGRWEALPSPTWSQSPPARLSLGHVGGEVRALAADGQGGFWAAVRQLGVCTDLDFCPSDLYFYHYTDRPPRPVFEDVAQPVIGGRITAAAAGADGGLWLGDDNGALYRYDRLSGWERGLRVPDWDPKGATVAHAVRAIAVGEHGQGIAVGAQGRIANLGPGALKLDTASDRACAGSEPTPPCGTGSDLLAAALAPDGSALAGGQSLALLWRPRGGEFRRLVPPPIYSGASFVDIALPRPDRAYLLTDGGEVFRGDPSAGDGVRWTKEEGVGGSAIEVDASGHGYAAGGRSLFERTGEGEWRALETGVLHRFSALATPAGGGQGALIGADNGLILTLQGERLEPARLDDPYDPVNASYVSPYGPNKARVSQLALAPGPEPGQVEAWAVAQAAEHDWNRSPVPQTLLHYASDPMEPLLDPERHGARPLPDSPLPRPGELAFAAFGKQDCQTFGELTCYAMEGNDLAADVVARRVSEEIAARSQRVGGPQFALFTGDASDAAGEGGQLVQAPTARNRKQRRWIELVADRLDDQLPVFGAIGGQDLSKVESCPPFVGACLDTKKLSRGAGPNLDWRRAMAALPAPWEEGAAEPRGPGRLSFKRLDGGPLARPVPNVELSGPSVQALGVQVQPPVERVSTGGAATHYAVDVLSGERKLARLVFVDTSLRSLSAADPVQQPQEAGGQQAWLERVLCLDGGPTDTNTPARDCTRSPDQRAIVVSNTPTYSYGPISPTETATDAATFESALIEGRANVVVSGRLGWQGLYWTLAPGVHSPCPGGAYSERPPSTAEARCQAAGTESAPDPAQPASEAQAELAEALRGLGAGAAVD